MVGAGVITFGERQKMEQHWTSIKKDKGFPFRLLFMEEKLIGFASFRKDGELDDLFLNPSCKGESSIKWDEYFATEHKGQQMAKDKFVKMAGAIKVDPATLHTFGFLDI